MHPRVGQGADNAPGGVSGRGWGGYGSPMPSPHGTLAWEPLPHRLDVLAPPVAAAASLVPSAQVALIDEALADTAAFCAAYDVDPAASANCVVVRGTRKKRETYAAVVVLATDRADVNHAVRAELDARKVSFAAEADAQDRTGMRQGGITPIGLPQGWPLLIDEAVLAAGPVVVGAGERGAKILLDAADLASLPGARVIRLALPRP